MTKKDYIIAKTLNKAYYDIDKTTFSFHDKTAMKSSIEYIVKCLCYSLLQENSRFKPNVFKEYVYKKRIK